MNKRTKYWTAACAALFLAIVVPPIVARDFRDVLFLFVLLVIPAIAFGIALLSSLKRHE